ncbi:hypothetical protein, partial [Streptomyces sp. MUM 203J]|uniref:hypothetical protein n=1 Tax=Streptomyces sp. MUM 203J TaxID=2791990 RepID=UPI001F03EFF8
RHDHTGPTGRVTEPVTQPCIRPKPVPVKLAPDFAELERTLAEIGTTLHPDVIALQGSFSDVIVAG